MGVFFINALLLILTRKTYRFEKKKRLNLKRLKKRMISFYSVGFLFSDLKKPNYLKGGFFFTNFNGFFFSLIRTGFFYSKTKLSRIRQICKNIVTFTLFLNIFSILKTNEIYYSYSLSGGLYVYFLFLTSLFFYIKNTKLFL